MGKCLKTHIDYGLLQKSDKATETIMSPKPQNLQDISYLKQALIRSHQEVPGYLSGDDVRHVCSSYSAAFQMNISSGRIQVRILLLIGKFLTFELILEIFCL